MSFIWNNLRCSGSFENLRLCNEDLNVNVLSVYNEVPTNVKNHHHLNVEFRKNYSMN